MTGGSLGLYERARRVAPGGVHSPVRSFKDVGGAPIFFESARGATLTAVDGKTYVDFCMSFGPLILGHRDPDVSAVVHETVERAWSLGASEPYSLALAEWITSRLPWVEKLRFVSSGTEAVMSALRVARAATGRGKIVKFEGCYHGHADSLLVKAGSGLAGRAESTSAGVSRAVVDETLVAPLDDENALESIFSAHGSEIAAVLVEPLPANYGLLPQRTGFLEHLVTTARLHGSLVIFDEVISGFRVALGGMAALLSIRPDLVCYGKVMGGGFPAACYGGRAELMDWVAPSGPVYQAGTLSAHPVAIRAGLATLEKLERIDAFTVLERKARGFSEELSRRFREDGIALSVERFGSLFWIHVSTESPLRRPDHVPARQSTVFKSLFHAALEAGVYLPPSAYEVAFLSVAHDDSVLENAVGALSRAARGSYSRA